jgi:hypothetical protein
MLSLLPLALAAPPLEIKPFGFVRPSGAWIQDDDASSADQDGFSLNSRIGLGAKYGSCGIEAKLEVDLTPEIQPKDVWFAGRPVCWFGITAGQQKIPFSVHHLASDTRRLLPLSPRIIGAAGIGRDLGLTADLQIPIAQEVRATVWGGVYNGEGSNRIQNVNQDFEYALRGLITPFGTRDVVFEGSAKDLYLGVGGGWVYNLTGDGEGAEERNTFAADLQFSWKWLSIQGEFVDVEVFHASIDVPDFHIRGGYGQLGFYIPAPWLEDHVEVAGRFEWMDPNTAFADSGLSGSGASAQPLYQASRIVTVGANLYLLKPGEKLAIIHDLKLQLAYSHPEEVEGEQVKDDNFTGAATVRF